MLRGRRGGDTELLLIVSTLHRRTLIPTTPSPPPPPSHSPCLVPSAPFIHSGGRRVLFVQQRRGAPVCLEGLSPPPRRVSSYCKALWHPCLGWVLGSSNCSYKLAGSQDRVFKSACSPGVGSLFGNFCGGKRARKSCKAVWGFSSFLLLLISLSCVCTLLRDSRRTCEFRRGGCRAGEKRE